MKLCDVLTVKSTLVQSVCYVTECAIGVSSLRYRVSQSTFLSNASRLKSFAPFRFLGFAVLGTVLNIQFVPRSNAVRLGYKNQSVNAVQGSNRCLFSDPHKYTVWAGHTTIFKDPVRTAQ